MYFLTWIGLGALWTGILWSECRTTKRRSVETAEDWENFVSYEEQKQVFVFICGVVGLACYGAGHIPASGRRDSLPMALWAITGMVYIFFELLRAALVLPSLGHGLHALCCCQTNKNKRSSTNSNKKNNNSAACCGGGGSGGLLGSDFRKPSSVHDLELLVGIALFVSVTETLLMCRDGSSSAVEGDQASQSLTAYHWAVWALFIAEKWAQVWLLSMVSSFYIEPWRGIHLVGASHFYLVMVFYNISCWISSLAFAFRSMGNNASAIGGDNGSKIVAVIYVALIIKFRMLSAIVFWQQYQRQPRVSIRDTGYQELRNYKETSDTSGDVVMVQPGIPANRAGQAIYGLRAQYWRAFGYSVGSLLGMFVGQALFVLSILFFFFGTVSSKWYAGPVGVNVILLVLVITFFSLYGQPVRHRAWNERLVLCLVGILASIGYLMAGASVLGSYKDLAMPNKCFTDPMLAEHGIKRENLPRRLWWNAVNLLFRGLSLFFVSIFYYCFQPDNFWFRIVGSRKGAASSSTSSSASSDHHVALVLQWTAMVLPFMLWGTLGLLVEEGIEQETTVVMKAASCTIDFWEGLWEAVAPVALGFRFLLLSHFLGMTRCFQEKWCGAPQGFHHEPEPSSSSASSVATTAPHKPVLPLHSSESKHPVSSSSASAAGLHHRQHAGSTAKQKKGYQAIP
uniref:Uncharacterized protein n=1 Tax=Lotharella globosa TaxID=91324 RepID=A0A7S4DMY6_9EUKA|mmetsp:Transcript_1965/g.3895  ORF Transcript_1965/g.3895 Transcript_1965/m.3895 type:complete len:681 (+) Transcript_1965:98-2140(+)